jgi:hypothetical protein
VSEFLGRECAHGERSRPGSFNGHCSTTIKTTTGPVTIDRPDLRGADECRSPARWGHRFASVMGPPWAGFAALVM